MSEQPSRVWVIVSVDPENFVSTARLVAEAGVTIDTESPAIGVITGRTKQAVADRLGTLDGVLAVELERTFALPDPDSDLQ